VRDDLCCEASNVKRLSLPFVCSSLISLPLVVISVMSAKGSFSGMVS
jgi:hypothetical protein